LKAIVEILKKIKMQEEQSMYEQYIYDTKECHIGKLNIRDYKKNKLIVLNNLDESNYMEIIRFVLVEKFQSPAPELVKFCIGLKKVSFPDLNFSVLKDYMEHGYIFNIDV
jgi:hypothetical protein